MSRFVFRSFPVAARPGCFKDLFQVSGYFLHMVKEFGLGSWTPLSFQLLVAGVYKATRNWNESGVQLPDLNS